MITRKLIQQRPNTSVAFYTPSDEVINLINEHAESNLQSTVSADNLTKTISFTVSEENHTLLGNNEILNNAQQDRLDYCDDNGISYSIVES
tara:strand:- start:18 stop:290 length:273 start_codon:yes stop_codon:yes gene_type:complete